MKLPRCVEINCIIPTIDGACRWRASGETEDAFKRMRAHQKIRHGVFDTK